MQLQAIGRITATAAAHDDYETMARIVRPTVARAVFEPQSPSHHAAGLAAYVVWLSELHGDNDTDWLRA